MTQLTPPPPSSPPPLAVRIVTHNIRYAASARQRFKQEAPWSERRISLTQQLHFLTRAHFSLAQSVICLQEVLSRQFDDIVSSLGSEWAAVGAGRDDGKDQGERCAILWRAEAWDCLHFETVWLNETGEVGKKGWDAGSVRVVSCVVLQAKRVLVEREETGIETTGGAGKRLLVMNTHLDDQGTVARREGAKILLDVMKGLKTKWQVDSYVLAGDLNSEVDGAAYEILNGDSSGLIDAYTGVDGKGSRIYGDIATYTGFDGKGDGDSVKRIDFVFAPNENGQVDQMLRGYATMSSLVNRNRMSDHQAVVVDLIV